MQVLDCREVPEEYLSCNQLVPEKVYEVKEGHNKGCFYTIWYLEHDESKPMLLSLPGENVFFWEDVRIHFKTSKFKEVSAKIIIEDKE